MKRRKKTRRVTKKRRRGVSKKQKGGSAPLHKVAKRHLRSDTSHGTEVNGVPLVLYQSWWTDKVPPGMKKTIEAVIQKNPEFDYELYTDEDCRTFIQTAFGDEVVKAFDCLKPGAYKSDLWRYCILYERGGVYMDIKLDTYTKLIDLVKKSSILMVKDRLEDCIWNGFMIASPKCRFFKECIDKIVKNVKNKYYGEWSIDITGPHLLGTIFKKHSPAYTYKYKFETIDGIDRAKVVDIQTSNVILEAYPTYREEHKKNEKVPHYSVLWKRRDAFLC